MARGPVEKKDAIRTVILIEDDDDDDDDTITVMPDVTRLGDEEDADDTIIVVPRNVTSLEENNDDYNVIDLPPKVPMQPKGSQIDPKRKIGSSQRDYYPRSPSKVNKKSKGDHQNPFVDSVPTKNRKDYEADAPRRGTMGQYRERIVDNESKTYTKVRAGASTTLSAHAPGDPKQPQSFIDIDTNNEPKIGAYLGFNNVAFLRALAVSWPVLKANLAFDTSMKKDQAFEYLARDGDYSYRGVKYTSKWPLNLFDSYRVRMRKKSRYLACILVALEADLNSLGTRPKNENEEQQQKYLDDFSYTFSKDMGSDLPIIDFRPVSETDRFPYVYPPVLGPYNGEHRLEAINRCWHLLQYLRDGVAAKGARGARFSQKSLGVLISIDASYAPHWMRAHQKPTLLIIPIVWHKEKPFNGKSDLDNALEKAAEQGKELPKLAQTIVEDPRLLKSIGHFRDCIRRQYKCKELLIDIWMLRLFYTGDGVTKKLELTQQPWHVSQGIFNDRINSSFIIEVSFKALDDPDDPLYEVWD